MTTQHDKATRWRPRFSLRFLMISVTLYACWFGYDTQVRRRSLRLEQARDSVKRKLVELHWANTTDPQLRTIVGSLTKEFAGNTSPWVYEVIDVAPGTKLLPGASRRPLDDFERRALARIQAGETEVSQLSWDGTVRYVQAINSTKSCAACHTTTGPIAVVSVWRSAK
jgi:hypothetical protein